MQTNYAKRILILGLLFMLFETGIMANSGNIFDLVTNQKITYQTHDTTVINDGINISYSVDVQYVSFHIPNASIQELINTRVREISFELFKSKNYCEKIRDEMRQKYEAYYAGIHYGAQAHPDTKFALKSVTAEVISYAHGLLTINYDFNFNIYDPNYQEQNLTFSKIYYYDLKTGDEYTADEIFPSIYKNKINGMIEDRIDGILNNLCFGVYSDRYRHLLNIYAKDNEGQPLPIINFCKLVPSEGALIVSFPYYYIETLTGNEKLPIIYLRYDELKPYISPLGPLAFLRDQKPDTLPPMMKNLNQPLVMQIGSEYSRILSAAKADSIYIKRKIKNIVVKTGLTPSELTTRDSVNIRYNEKKWMVTYNEKGQLQQLEAFNIKDSLLNTTLCTYEHDNLTKVEKIREKGCVEKQLYQYDSRNNLLWNKHFNYGFSQIDVINYFYAPHYYVINGGEKCFLNETGQLQKEMNCESSDNCGASFTYYVYDTQNRLVNYHDYYNSHQLVYDDRGRLITTLQGHEAEVDERETVQYLYDDKGRLSVRINNSTGKYEKFQYNNRGEIISVTEIRNSFFGENSLDHFEVSYQYFDEDKK